MSSRRSKDYVPPIGPVNNVRPVGRDARRRHREQIEKTRLGQRNFGFIRHKDVSCPLNISENSCQYSDVTQQYIGDAAHKEKLARERQIKQKKTYLDGKRQAGIVREEERWREIEEEHSARDKRMQAARADPLTGKNCRNSMPYNPITLRYNDDPEGNKLHHEDNLTKYRGLLRSRRLDKYTNGGYNPITGAPRDIGCPPRRPQLETGSK